VSDQKPVFVIGDRVKLKNPTEHQHQMVHGVIVFHHGVHRKRNPRVRWASGWGVTVSADLLTSLSAGDLKQWPEAPATIPADHEDIRTLRARIQKELGVLA